MRTSVLDVTIQLNTEQDMRIESIHYENYSKRSRRRTKQTRGRRKALFLSHPFYCSVCTSSYTAQCESPPPNLVLGKPQAAHQLCIPNIMKTAADNAPVQTQPAIFFIQTAGGKNQTENGRILRIAYTSRHCIARAPYPPFLPLERARTYRMRLRSQDPVQPIHSTQHSAGRGSYP